MISVNLRGVDGARLFLVGVRPVRMPLKARRMPCGDEVAITGCATIGLDESNSSGTGRFLLRVGEAFSLLGVRPTSAGETSRSNFGVDERRTGSFEGLLAVEETSFWGVASVFCE